MLSTTLNRQIISKKPHIFSLFQYLNKPNLNTTRYVRRIAKKNDSNEVNNDGNKTKDTNEDGLFVVTEKEMDLKSENYGNLSTLARIAIETDPNLIRSLGGKNYLNKDNKLVLKEYNLKDDYEKLSKSILNEEKHVQESVSEKSKVADETVSDTKQNASNNEIQENVAEKQESSESHQQDHDTEQEEATMNQVAYTFDASDVVEDKSIPKTKVACGGCGARFHCKDKNKNGFISATYFKAIPKHELQYAICYRCELLKRNQKQLTLKTLPYDYDKNIIEKIAEKENVLVILLVDLTDIPNSIYDGWSKLIYKPKKTSPEVKSEASEEDLTNEIFKTGDNKKKIDIFVVGNKFDLLVNTGPGWKDAIYDCLIQNCKKKGIDGDQIKHVELISAKTNYHIEELIEKIFSHWKCSGDIFLLGVANAGKSMLFNKLLSSDLCQVLASDALNRATTSFWPNTTLNVLRFPIHKLQSDDFRIRDLRLEKDKEKQQKLDFERFDNFRRYFKLDQSERPDIYTLCDWATAKGFVGKSFTISNRDKFEGEIDVNIEPTFSFEPVKGGIVSAKTYSGTRDKRKEEIENARKEFDVFIMKYRFCFYDTPGVLTNSGVLNQMSDYELSISLPSRMMLPRVVWMDPGQTYFVGGIFRIDLLETSDARRVFFTTFASHRMHIIHPFNTSEAEERYEELYRNNKLVVPTKRDDNKHKMEFPKLVSRDITVNCTGNNRSTGDIVFSSFGWVGVSGLPGQIVKLRVHTIDEKGLQWREPSLLPFAVNLRQRFTEKTRPQVFKKDFRWVSYEKTALK